MKWRNAFAHGEVVHDSNQGTLLRYYSGAHKTLNLNEQFCNLVEATFSRLQVGLKEISDGVAENYKKSNPQP